MSAPDRSSRLLPVVIGVVGHRDLRPSSEPAIRAAVADVLRSVREALPHTPLVLLSSLAGGADQLVAEEFLGMPDDGGGRQLIVPLPLPQMDYEGDFADAQGREQFRSLLARGVVVEVAHLGGALDQRNLAVRHPHLHAADSRQAAYRRTGTLIARSSHLVLALWNGEDTELPAGTAEIVRFRLDGIPAGLVSQAEPLAPVERGPLIHIHAPRVSESERPDSAAGRRRVLVPGQAGGRHSSLDAVLDDLSSIESFNAKVALELERGPSRFDDSRRSLLGTDPPPLDAGAESLADLFASADMVAIGNQRLAYSAARTLLAAGVLALLADNVFERFLAKRPMAIAYLAIVAIGAGLLALTRRRGWQRDHQNARALAEAVRVQFFWLLAGVRQTVADIYLRVNRDELQHVRFALRGALLRALALRPADPGAVAVTPREFVVSRWLRSQREYFVGTDGKGGAATRMSALHHRLHWARDAAFVCTLVVLLFAPAVIAFAGTETPMATGAGVWAFLVHSAREHVVRSVLATLGGFLAAVAAALAAYAAITGSAEHARNSRRMGEAYLRAEAQLAAGDEANAMRVLEEIGREAATENAEWFILHQHRPIEFEVG